MQRKITGFHRDEHGDWVADLGCGHRQHMRHRPPWTNRPWGVHAGRPRTPRGQPVRCKQCDKERQQQ